MPRPEPIVTHNLTVSRTARFCTLGPFSQEARDVWITCHGYRQLAADFIRPFTVLDNGHRLIVAPEGLSRFYYRDSPRAVGASWMTREDRLREIDDYVGYLDRLHDTIFERVDRATARLRVLGFSQGAATVTRWLSRTDRRVDDLILWGGLFAPEIVTPEGLRPFGRCRITIVVGEDDTLVHDPDITENRERLAGAGVEASVIRFRGGHRLSRQVLVALADQGN